LRPNIIFILADDQRWDTTDATHSLDGVTPVMPGLRSELGGSGVEFTEAFMTTPLCCPSRSSILRGQHANITHVYTNDGVNGGADDPLKSHRREVTVVFIDLRGFTAFAETAEPEEVMSVLREYHAAMGELILTHEGTLERFTGDGMMIFFNDPVPVPNPQERAVRMALAMRARVDELMRGWRKRGYELDFGVGIAEGYATIGAIGFEGRWDYGAIGTVTNLAARLCGEAKPGQILISRKLHGRVDDLVAAESVGELALKGFSRPVSAYNLTALKAE